MISLDDGYCEHYHLELLDVAKECADSRYTDINNRIVWAKIATLSSREQWPELVQVYNENKLNF